MQQLTLRGSEKAENSNGHYKIHKTDGNNFFEMRMIIERFESNRKRCKVWFISVKIQKWSVAFTNGRQMLLDLLRFQATENRVISSHNSHLPIRTEKNVMPFTKL